jgi:hypothetical protein
MEFINKLLGRENDVSNETRELATSCSRGLGRDVRVKEKTLLHPSQIAEADLDDDEIQELRNKKHKGGMQNGEQQDEGDCE